MSIKRLIKSDKKERKIPVLVMLTTDEINYLDSNINKKDLVKKSRSAYLRFLIRQDMKKNKK